MARTPSAFEWHPLPSKGEACLLNKSVFSSTIYLPNWLEKPMLLILCDELSLARKQMDYQESFAE